VLQAFSDKHDIVYPLLSDVKSEVIRTYGLLNSDVEPGHKNYGIPNPGLLIIDENLRVIDKQFEKSYAARPTAENVLVRFFDHSTATYLHNFKTPYLSGSIAISDTVAFRAQILVVVVDVRMQDNYHVYGRPVPDGYIPFAITIAENRDFQLDDVVYPEMQKTVLQDLNETFFLLPDRFSLKTNLRIQTRPAPGKHTVNIKLSFQACDDKVCFLPEDLIFEFPLTVKR